MNRDKKNFGKLEEEFRAFMGSDSAEPDSALSFRILRSVRASLSPRPVDVFKKLGIVQIFSGAVMLLFCPQFGVGPLGGGHGWMHYFMAHGWVACATACGALFIGTAALASQLVLTRQELRVAYRTGLWQFPLLGVMSVAILMLLAPMVGGHASETSPEFILFWLLGGTLAAQVLNFAMARMRRIHLAA